ncbi:MAG: hypothetical protein ACOX34_04200 [Bacillota bacterium]|jgi:hypothetical protein|nr:hypothetical protein [Candidatus Fermentithermobacillaceae bacterium]
MRVIGIAGTAKNTGKTTTLVASIKFFAENQKMFITGIGYDGEDFDNLTGLPKPRVFVPEGAIVASALPLLESSDAKFTDLSDTGVRCALGRIFSGTATAPGQVVLAGPASTRDLSSVLAFAPDDSVVLLDGAFSRISPMVVADSLILATGAARSRDSHRIAREINAIDRIMGLPVVDGPGTGDVSGNGVSKMSGGLFLPGQGHELAWRLNGAGKAQTVYVTGIVNPQVFLEALEEINLNGHRDLTIVFDHPIMLLLSGDLLRWEEVFSANPEERLTVAVRASTELLGVTINPYTPTESGAGKYVATYVPPESFLGDIDGLTRIACTDIMFEGPGKLHSWLEKFLD